MEIIYCKKSQKMNLLIFAIFLMITAFGTSAGEFPVQIKPEKKEPIKSFEYRSTSRTWIRPYPDLAIEKVEKLDHGLQSVDSYRVTVSNRGALAATDVFFSATRHYIRSSEDGVIKTVDLEKTLMAFNSYL